MSEETTEHTVQRTVLPPVLSDGERRRRARARIPALTVLYHPDLSRVGENALLHEIPNGRRVLLSRLEPLFTPPGAASFQALADRHLSRSPLALEPAAEPGAVRLALEGSRTPVAVDGEAVEQARNLSAAQVERGVVVELAGRVVLLLHTLPAVPPPRRDSLSLVGESEGIARVREEVWRVADLELPVLLRGETGTGKELVARAIHQASRRRAATWLSVNMGAIPATLAASELFGAVKGAFTGAVRDQPGYFQRAHGGTLFLDEIGEAPAEVQVMLLRVLESGELQRVGSPEPQRVDTRLIAATDADLERACRDGRFRLPLLHRLSGYEIVIPPLRERRDDFGRLFVHFLREELRQVGEEHRLDLRDDEEQPWLPASIVARLARYHWPGNVRQLRNTVRQLVVGSRSGEIRVGPQLERLLREAARPEATTESGEAATRREPVPAPRRAQPREYRLPSDVGEAEVLEALRANRWEVKPAAEQLGISRPSLYVLMEKYPSIHKAGDLSRAEILEARARCGNGLEALAEHLEVSRKGLQQRMKQLGIE